MKLKPHFLIYGVGAVGGMYGAQLLNAKNKKAIEANTSFIARNQGYEALKKQGIKFHVVNDDGSKEIYDSSSVDVYDDIEKFHLADDEYLVILLCVKSKDTKDCAAKILKLVQSQNITDYTVISIQNGVENEDILAQKLGKENVVAAYTNVLAEVIAPGDYIRKGSYWLCLGELEGNQDIEINSQNRIGYLKNIFEQANLVIKTSTDIRADLWEKLVWNAAFNPASVLYEADITSLLQNPEAVELIKNIMRETRELAQFLNIQVNPEIDTKHFQRTSAFNWQGFKTSMLQDYLRGRKLELDQLLGVVVRLAKENSIDLPHSKSLYQKLLEKLG